MLPLHTSFADNLRISYASVCAVGNGGTARILAAADNKQRATAMLKKMLKNGIAWEVLVRDASRKYRSIWVSDVPFIERQSSMQSV